MTMVADAELFARAFSSESPEAIIHEMTAEQRENYSRWLDDIAERPEMRALLTASAFVRVPENVTAQGCVEILKERAARRLLEGQQSQIETAGANLDDLLRLKLAAARRIRG